MYTKKSSFYPWLLFPIIPFLLGLSMPWTIGRLSPLPGSCWFALVVYTNSIKPIGQILSHLPQLYVCYKLRSTSGVSMLTQHLNLIGGITGVSSIPWFWLFWLSWVVTLLIKIKTIASFLIYFFSTLQALSLYALAWKFDGWESINFSLQSILSETIFSPRKSIDTRSPETDLSDRSDERSSRRLIPRKCEPNLKP